MVLVGREFWRGLVDWLRDTVIAGGKASPTDLEAFSVVDTADEVMAVIKTVDAGPDTVERTRPE